MKKLNLTAEPWEHAGELFIRIDHGHWIEWIRQEEDDKGYQGYDLDGEEHTQLERRRKEWV